VNGPESPTVARVLRGQLCTGCGLCASLSGGEIEMTTVAPGYARPSRPGPLSPAAERMVAEACPGSRVEPWTGKAPNLHPYWGPWRRVATGHSTDEALRHRASSGGAVTALALHALRSRLVDRVVHVTADPQRPTRNIVVCSTSEAEVIAGAGSRYAASSPLAEIDGILSDGGRFAFIGKPCDVSALRRLGRVDPRVEAHVPLMLSFFCAGVPSHAGADRVLAAMGCAPEEVVAFRYRGEGWPGFATATLRDGRQAQMSYADSWGGHLSKEVQFRCKICPDAVGGVADIACADAWYGDEAGYPSFEEQAGRSLIVARTARGEAHLEAAVSAGALAVEPLPVDEIDAMQPSQARRKRLIQARTAGVKAMLQPCPEMADLSVAEAARRAQGRETLKDFLGTVRRILQGRR
jgi:coenzyme F420 hydrogenase subunit beta